MAEDKQVAAEVASSQLIDHCSLGGSAVNLDRDVTPEEITGNGTQNVIGLDLKCYNVAQSCASSYSHDSCDSSKLKSASVDVAQSCDSSCSISSDSIKVEFSSVHDLTKPSSQVHNLSIKGRTFKQLFTCVICKRTFSHPANLDRHQTKCQREHCEEDISMEKEERDKKYSCGTCGLKFVCVGHLERHIRIHTGEKPYACDECGQKFARSSNLYRHQRNHKGDKLYTCPTCGAGFTRNNDIKRHAMIHTGERPFACDTCGDRFLRRCHLKRHIRTHTGERSFLCHTCGKRFADAFALKLHSHVHVK